MLFYRISLYSKLQADKAVEHGNKNTSLLHVGWTIDLSGHHPLSPPPHGCSGPGWNNHLLNSGQLLKPRKHRSHHFHWHSPCPMHLKTNIANDSCKKRTKPQLLLLWLSQQSSSGPWSIRVKVVSTMPACRSHACVTTEALVDLCPFYWIPMDFTFQQPWAQHFEHLDPKSLEISGKNFGGLWVRLLPSTKLFILLTCFLIDSSYQHGKIIIILIASSVI